MNKYDYYDGFIVIGISLIYKVTVKIITSNLISFIYIYIYMGI